MNSKLSHQMTLLGVCAIAFYAAMTASGHLSIELLPQFMVSAIIFIAAGPLLRKTGRGSDQDEEVDPSQEPPTLTERDWSYFSILLNWSMALLIIACLAVWVMKPLGMPFKDYLVAPVDHDQVFSEIIAP